MGRVFSFAFGLACVLGGFYAMTNLTTWAGSMTVFIVGGLGVMVAAARGSHPYWG